MKDERVNDLSELELKAAEKLKVNYDQFIEDKNDKDLSLMEPALKRWRLA